ncbi:hypothetical protein HYV50_04795 [Candidatus Pacearchaeota archaeon]|nr:hypothetical protein [Candidatus Pacearchaeota archaeon]
MKKGLIITLPRHDVVTEYLAYFSKQIIDEAENNNLPCKQLKDKEVKKDNFEKIVKNIGYKLLVLNGHGTTQAIYGYANQPLVEEGTNEEILTERITYARACDSAFSLGKVAMKNNKEGCFIGYELPFQFYCDITWEGNPGKDKVAPIFLEPSNTAPTAIIKGKTAEEAHSASKRAILKNMNKVLRKADPESLAIAEALWNNYEGQVLLGNLSATL